MVSGKYPHQTCERYALSWSGHASPRLAYELSGAIESVLGLRKRILHRWDNQSVCRRAGVGHFAWRSTRSAAELRTSRLAPWYPCDGITIGSE